jgi:hypothetical protein
MNTCATCRHWGTEAYTYYADDGPSEPGHRICGKIGLLNDSLKQVEVRAFTIDGSGYLAELWTQSDFACVLWEPPETPA